MSGFVCPVCGATAEDNRIPVGMPKPSAARVFARGPLFCEGTHFEPHDEAEMVPAPKPKVPGKTWKDKMAEDTERVKDNPRYLGNL